jgi:cytochrome P450
MSRPYPPGPPGVPILGNAVDALRDPIALFCAGTADYGDIVGFHMLNMRYVLVNAPDAIRHVLVENPKNYTKSRNYAGLKVLLGEGLLTAEGETWRRQRKLMQPAFHRERIASFVETMGACTTDMLARWSVEGSGRLIDVHREMVRLTFRIVGRTLLSEELDGDSREIGEALNVALRWANDYVESLVRIPPAVPTRANRRMRAAARKFDSLIQRLIDERRRGVVPKPDLLSMLLDARDEDTGEAMSDMQLRHELLTMVAAGHETTANALSFALYLLSKHPEWMRAVRKEADAVLGDRTPTVDDVRKLTTTSMVVEETLRLYPPAWVFERQALGEDEIGGFAIPKDAVVGICPFVLHRSPKLWENPEGFDPTRFSPAAKEARHKYAYLPFGGGPRTCIGNVFALTEATLVLAMIVKRFRLELLPGHDLVLDPLITLRPKGPLPMRVCDHEAPRARITKPRDVHAV